MTTAAVLWSLADAVAAWDNSTTATKQAAARIARELAASETGHLVEPAKVIAGRLGTTTTATASALRLLERHGVIEKIGGARYTTPHARTLPAQQRDPSTRPGFSSPDDPRKWVQCANLITGHIEDGTYPDGKPLPAIGVLSTTYQYSYAVVKRALTETTARGITTQDKTTYYAGTPARARRKPGRAEATSLSQEKLPGEAASGQGSDTALVPIFG